MASVAAVELTVHDKPQAKSSPVVTGPEFGVILSQPGELASWNLWRAAIIEFLGMTFFLFFVLGAFNATQGSADNEGTLALLKQGTLHIDEPADIWHISFVAGITMSILVYISAPFSGGHLNPAVSFALAISKKISLVRFVVYVVFQIFGAAFGAWLCQVVYDHDDGLYSHAINEVSYRFNDSQAFLAEIIGTALLVGAFLASVDANNGHPQPAKLKNSLGVAMIGISYSVAHCILIPVTNCSINPARAFGSSIVADHFNDHYIMWFAPLSGALIATVFYEGIFKDRK